MLNLKFDYYQTELNTIESLVLNLRSLYILWLDANGYELEQVYDPEHTESKEFLSDPVTHINNLEQLFKDSDSKNHTE